MKYKINTFLTTHCYLWGDKLMFTWVLPSTKSSGSAFLSYIGYYSTAFSQFFMSPHEMWQNKSGRGESLFVREHLLEYVGNQRTGRICAFYYWDFEATSLSNMPILFSSLRNFFSLHSRIWKDSPCECHPYVLSWTHNFAVINVGWLFVSVIPLES